MVVAPLLAEGSVGASLFFYRGRTPDSGRAEGFSFFPAVLHDQHPEGFVRPVLRPTGALSGMITETLIQGQRPNPVADADQVRDIWQEVVDQVLAQGCLLGVHAEAPPVGRRLVETPATTPAGGSRPGSNSSTSPGWVARPGRSPVC